MGDISMWMVIETTRENEISPKGEQGYVEKKEDLRDGILEKQMMKVLN